jgi:hypothetical protein
LPLFTNVLEGGFSEVGDTSRRHDRRWGLK